MSATRRRAPDCLIAIDPSPRSTGWAEATRGEFWMSSPPCYGAAPAEHVFLALAARHDRAPVNVAVIEDQYVAKNARVALDLAALRGMFAGFIHARWPEAEIWIVPAQTWQTRTLGRGSYRMPRAERKRASVATVKMLYDIECGPDEADAIMLGSYALDCLRVGVDPGERAFQIPATGTPPRTDADERPERG